MFGLLKREKKTGNASGGYRWGELKTADGPVVRYRLYDGNPDIAPVLCLHGLTRNSRDFEELAPMIAEATGRRVIVPEMRGRGRSDADPQPERYNPAVYVADVLALLEDLNVEKALWVGTSMGGLITMIAAHSDPEKVAAAAINDIGPELQTEGITRIESYVCGDSGPAKDWGEAAERTKGVNGVAFPGETQAFWERFAWRLYRETPDGLVLDYDTAISGNVSKGETAPPDMWPFFEALKPVPTLLFRGAITDLLDPETVARMQEIKPDLAVVEVAGVGHAPFMTEPDAWPKLEAFLKAQKA
ncbi:alpha/beta fold hydrolase [Euryhalocaulis caribicus]|uniref:alpha/beta fold hydrolase n=1 Tax=Euryhalocaulis caribicus TaxID=1161401 RepID=UPI0003A7E668|nr:alpha/beta hydrolase [Euryhalocaulis caribicus]